MHGTPETSRIDECGRMVRHDNVSVKRLMVLSAWEEALPRDLGRLAGGPHESSQCPEHQEHHRPLA